MKQLIWKLTEVILNAAQRVYSAVCVLHVKMRCASHGAPIRANGWTVVTRNTHLGSYVNFNGLVIKGAGKVTIGNHFHSGSECLILTQNHNYEGTKLPYDETYIIRPVTIEDNVWLGDRITLLAGVTIGEGAIVQAGSVVVKNVAPCSIVGGSPAVEFKKRDKEHYEKLKAERMFH